ncbi:hypothetical protein TMEN_9991 [Trichophyton mentagrophytes]|nr:hypothetical protein TMEN_9991 [Trichophyton mentagrophytes]
MADFSSNSSGPPAPAKGSQKGGESANRITRRP